MSNYTENDLEKDLQDQEYKYGFVTNIESDKIPVGLNEDIIRLISSKRRAKLDAGLPLKSICCLADND